MTDIFGKFLGAILAFILMICSPLVLTLTMEEITDRRSVINECSNLVDEVCDTRTLTEDQLADFNLGVASFGLLLDTEVNRYMKVINPDPNNPGQTHTSYVLTDNNSTFNQGDLIEVKVDTIGFTAAQTIVLKLAGVILPDFEYKQVGRVR